MNGIFTVPYPYVKAEEVVARPQLRRETLEATEVVGFSYESDGRESEAKEFGVRSEWGSVGESAEGYQTAKTRWEKAQAKYERRVLHDSDTKCRRGTRSEWLLWTWSLWRCRDFVGKVSVGRKG